MLPDKIWPSRILPDNPTTDQNRSTDFVNFVEKIIVKFEIKLVNYWLIGVIFDLTGRTAATKWTTKSIRLQRSDMNVFLNFWQTKKLFCCHRIRIVINYLKLLFNEMMFMNFRHLLFSRELSLINWPWRSQSIWCHKTILTWIQNWKINDW